MKLSAYVPCFNNEATVLQAVQSIQRQSLPVDDLYVVDDGSSDRSVAVVESAGIRVIRMGSNLGRGAVRARAMEEARHDLVLCCDATNELPSFFLETALRWFDEPAVGAVFGRISQSPGGNAVRRWRGRHLYRVTAPQEGVNFTAAFATYGALLRKSASVQAGGFDCKLRHTEDADLGMRLRAIGWRVVFDPKLVAHSLSTNTMAQVLERYWRWNAGAAEQISLLNYARHVWFSLRVMVPADCREGDIAASFISFLAPHYQFWKSLIRRGRKG